MMPFSKFLPTDATNVLQGIHVQRDVFQNFLQLRGHIHVPSKPDGILFSCQQLDAWSSKASVQHVLR